MKLKISKMLRLTVWQLFLNYFIVTDILWNKEMPRNNVIEKNTINK